ncbi:MAG: L-seryl-tRNA(Sec) selenium transferase [Actinomycetota bacterium]|nr:L-seryl-tRNA(Sec) selenium transferase [Actinomycetota bacterium]
MSDPPAASSDRRRAVPRTDRLLAEPKLQEAASVLGADLVKQAVHVAQQRVRDGELPPDAVLAAVVESLPAAATTLRRVINATGVVVHTNLGRAPLSAAAVRAVGVAAGTTDLELDLRTGRRGRRGAGAVAALLQAVPEAEDAHVVNNGAAALALLAAAYAGQDVVVARGELVEIGDGFRIPELLTAAGVRLREVGTTNRVRPQDYADAVGEHTGFVLKVHPSNFVVSGFTSTVPVETLAELPVPVVADIGSGLLAPHPRLPDEPDAAGVLRRGADLVTASGDKLLGGPQCGLLLGRAELVQRLRRHPVARALRVDKLTLAALEATLRGPAPPVRRALDTRPEELRRRAEAIARRLDEIGVDATPAWSTACVGGGGAPDVSIPSAAVSLPDDYAGRLRAQEPAVLGRLTQQRLLLDLVAVDPDDDEALVHAVHTAGAG